MKSLNEFKIAKPAIVVEEEKSDYSKFDALVRAGLANKAQMSRIHRILDKMQEEKPTFNTADRELLQNLFNRMVDLVSNNKQIFQKTRQVVREQEEIDEGVVVTSDLKYNPKTGRKYPAHRKVMGGESDTKQQVQESTLDVPFILVLKRKAIRMYPDGTKIALYHNEKLNKYFSVPYSTDKNIDAAIQAEETDITNVAFDSIRYIAESKNANYIVFNNGASHYVDVDSAQSILSLHESLSFDNKKVLEENLASGKPAYKKIAEFAREHIK